MKVKGEMKTVALVGNPNVGKTSLFNLLTGNRAHTGNWSGKTVDLSRGVYKDKYRIIDLPGTYSLNARSREEEVVGEYLSKPDFDVCCVICDPSCLERNLLLLFQVLEITSRVILVLNFWDETERYGIKIDREKLSSLLHIPVVTTRANSKKGIGELVSALGEETGKGSCLRYDGELEYALTLIDDSYTRREKLAIISSDAITEPEFIHAYEYLWGIGYYPEKCREEITTRLCREAERICDETVTKNNKRQERNRRIDKLLTGRFTALPIMVIMLFCLFYITAVGANYPSALLSMLFSKIGKWLEAFLIYISLPEPIRLMLVYGLWRVLTFVVAVMLPPMAIFFPLFTLLEDCGFLPRIAFNMDSAFSRCGSCGKQGLTMCMGLGCNAVGVTGARIIDTKRERLTAILTNAFVPCNGRFPMLITLAGIFFGSALSPFVLTAVILIGIAITFPVSKLLSMTLLKGKSSAFALELPPYRMPNIPRVILRSFLDRTVFVLGRAISVAAPAGVLIWLAANIDINGITLLSHMSAFLDNIAAPFGLDGVIVTAFILGFPANEIVLPLIVMGYLGSGVISEVSAESLSGLLVSKGWDTLKCISVLIFCICHFPCSTTLLTVKKETGRVGYAILAAIIPTAVGLFLCFAVNLIFGG